MRSDLYQLTLISLGVVATAFFGVFIYREAFPEYKIYQKKYIELEKFRSTFTGEPPPDFSIGIKQIVLPREDKGPPVIDRCISCHVALTFPHFASEMIARDADGTVITDENGVPKKIANPDNIFTKLDAEIKKLESENRIAESKELKSLKTATVNGREVDITKVLKMHPLMGKETRPFEFHPMDEYGCTSCHNGNGLGLTSEKAHGPVFDGQYEVEFEGPVLKFTETDELNDPPFAKQYNGKPGHELLFQTSPIFVGALIEAKCMQCHESKEEAKKTASLTQNFERGKNLFISQGCYACHRIAGLARGGVGPELTEIGKGYPWAIKQKIVWPQGNLKNSTMPNYRLDHVEVEDLMAFLLAQTGENKAVSEVGNKIHLKNWENGERKPFEMAIAPSEIHDLRKSMTIFATEGCAACHRLKGFESNVGFAIEKENPNFKELYQTKEWFKQLIPESIVGSSLVKVLDKNAEEIDKRILNDVRDGSILEEIEKNFPDVIQTFYTDFSFASRAKNHEYLTKVANEIDPLKKQEILRELEAWKERVTKVLMIYIQEYGLGRIIGPKPNWSGVYRTDEWLMQHFRNPSGLIPNSIMPVFPFDDTKFYALTYMLDILGVKNRNEVREIWEHNGFNPALAYEIHCAQCHGNQLGGNGPVSDWIYPVPKNLRNAEFLRNLTKENAVNSIVHGIKGTPMAPWGEAPNHKPDFDGIPVLSRDEATSLVDWMFFKISGEKVIINSSNVPKWQYEPEDIQEELNLTDSIFDETENLGDSSDKKSFYIKQKYYTDENLEAGRQFFVMNCAICHGKEGDGTGARGGVMQDAKPRNLTNFEWLDTRDDLRLLRSIKYGVPGTSMGAWGDLTSSLQRMKLVMFIRSINEDSKFKKMLNAALYEAFEPSFLLIEDQRSKEFTKMNELKRTLNEPNTISNDETEAIKNFKEKFNAQKEFNLLNDKDQKLLSLQMAIKNVSKTYQQLGNEFIDKKLPLKTFQLYIDMINQNQGLYTVVNKEIRFKSDIVKNISLKQELLIQEINQQIQDFEKRKAAFNPDSSEYKKITNEIKGYEQLKNSVDSGLKKVFELMALQEKVLNND